MPYRYANRMALSYREFYVYCHDLYLTALVYLQKQTSRAFPPRAIEAMIGVLILAR